MTKFDLHLHSNNSDGSETVEGVINAVIDSGIKIFALTDHDTVEGIREAEKLTPDNIKFIKGVELTCKTNDIKCHILGYNINPETKELKSLIEYGKTLRRKKLETRIKYLKDVWNIELTKDELSRCQNGILKAKRGQNIKFLPFAFTDLGVAMLSSVLKSTSAIKVNREIMRAFVTFRHLTS